MIAYMGFNRHFRKDTAILIFANNITEAKGLGWVEFLNFSEAEEDAFRVERLENQEKFLALEIAKTPCATAEIPPGFTCQSCDQWGGDILKSDSGENLCEDCFCGDS